jgi:hypothetical protein
MKFILPAALLPVVLAIACNRANREAKELLAKADSSAVAFKTPETPDEQKEAGAPKQKGNTTGTGQPQSGPNPDWDKKIVKTADLNVEVRNFREYTDRLHQKVRAAGGYIAQEEQNSSAYKIEDVVTVKVPVDRFDETVVQLSSDSDKLVSKKISTEDVTMQLVDTRSLLETKREVRLRYLELLRQAHSMKDILQVQSEINDIQEQMDGAAGRIAYLGHAATYSTIHLNFYQVLDATVKNEEDPGFLRKLSGAFKEGWNWVSSLMIGLVGLWPLLLAGLLVLLWWRRRVAVRRATVAVTGK